MSGGFPLNLDICAGVSFANTANSRGASLTPSATANTKGSYAVLIAATANDTCWIYVCCGTSVASTSGEYQVDIAIGATGSELNIINNLLVSSSTGDFVYAVFILPITIPAGSKISARCASRATSDVVLYCAVSVFDGGFTQMEGAAGLDAIGISGAFGTTVTSSGSTNTKGSYAPLIAATLKDYFGFYVVIDNLDDAGMPASATTYLVDISIGAGGSELVIIPNIAAAFNPSAPAVTQPQVIGPFFIQVPAGTRIAARSQASIASSAMSVAVYGLYQ